MNLLLGCYAGAMVEGRAWGVFCILNSISAIFFGSCEAVLAPTKERIRGQKISAGDCRVRTLSQFFPRTYCFILRNRSDLKERREVSQEEGKQYAESVGAMWIETR